MKSRWCPWFAYNWLLRKVNTNTAPQLLTCCPRPHLSIPAALFCWSQEGGRPKLRWAPPGCWSSRLAWSSGRPPTCWTTVTTRAPPWRLRSPSQRLFAWRWRGKQWFCGLWLNIFRCFCFVFLPDCGGKQLLNVNHTHGSTPVQQQLPRGDEGRDSNSVLWNLNGQSWAYEILRVTWVLLKTGNSPWGKASVRRQMQPPVRRVDIRDFFLPITSRAQMHRRCAGTSVIPNRNWTRKMLRPNLPTFRARQK